MGRICRLLMMTLVLESVLWSEALIRNKKREKAKKVKGGNIASQLASLQKNVSSLWTEMNDRESTRVMVHVHGLGDDPAETHEKEGGTHVHIHMHLEDNHDDDHDHHRDHGHEDHHEGNDSEDHGHHDHDHDHDHDHGGKKKGCGMMKKKMKKMHDHVHFPSEDTYVYSHCQMAMNPTVQNSQHKINGSIYFRQKMNRPLEVLLHLKGFFVPKGDHSDRTHGFHVHQYADLTNGCQSFGGHFNPDGVTHAAKDAHERHAGDWGNIACNERGEVHSNMTDNHTSLVGAHSIVGRGLVIHEHEDDLGLGGIEASLKTGNAGGRLACCVVGWSGEHDWDMLLKHKH